MSPTPMPDAAWLRGLTSRRVSRRDMLRAMGLGAGALATAAVLGSCSVAGSQAPPLASDFWSGQKKAGHLDWAQWPLYIDTDTVNGKTTYPSLELFTKQTGITVNYQEVIQDVESYFGVIRPVLAAGQSTGFDLMVITNGIYLTQLIELNFLIPLDHKLMPNFFANAGATVKNPSFDPGNKYTAAWQSGITGIAYNPKYVKRKITSFNDLLDPAFIGKVGMFGDNQDLPNLALSGIGVNPETSTEADWRRAAKVLIKQRDAGLVRAYYQQEYIAPLSKGDLWISMAWSGDIFQANQSTPGLDLQFVVPDEGAVVWTDNLCIPRYARHPVDAMAMINFMYQPQVAAMVAEGVNYFTPVPGARKYIQQDAAAATDKDDKELLTTLADSPLIFPSPQMLSRLHRYRTLSPQELEVWNQIFEPVYQS